MDWSNIFCDFELGLVWKRGPGQGGSSVVKWRVYGMNSNTTRGYCQMNFQGKPQFIHRIIYAYFHNISLDTLGVMDHVDQNKMNNRIDNLREATSSENQLNRTKTRDNTSGHKNICWHKRVSKWQFQIVINGKKTSKYFKNLQEAIAYRDDFYTANPDILFGNNNNNGPHNTG